MGTVIINAVTYTIYGTQTGATEYLNAKYGASAAWTAASSDDQKRVLVSATRQLDRLSMDWTGILDPPSTSPSIPDDVISAAYEWASLILADSSIQDGNSLSNIKIVQAGSAKVEYFRPQTKTSLPLPVRQLLNEYYTGNIASGIGYASGSDEESVFATGDYELNQGL